MKITVEKCVWDSKNVMHDCALQIKSKFAKDVHIPIDDCIAYPPLINCHDHLIGNWFPKAGGNNPYKSVDIWVDEMRYTPTFLERNKIWKGEGKFDLTSESAELVTMIGAYKNLFSGAHVVQDHISNQHDSYYEKFPIQVLKEYRQCHSMSMGNWWGGKSAYEEYLDTKGEMLFVTHLAEGTNESASKSFDLFKNSHLLQANSMLVHGIALTEEQIAECAKAGTSICWCPNSNMFLIGQTLNLKACLKHGVNVVIGTDSTMSGCINLLEEIKFGYSLFPDIDPSEIFKMVTENAQKALMIPKDKGCLVSKTENLLLLRKQDSDPYKNLLLSDQFDIKFLMSGGVPLLGDKEILDNFDIDPDQYFFFQVDETERFVYGHPDKLNQKVNEILGYEKKFPFFPF